MLDRDFVINNIELANELVNKMPAIYKRNLLNKYDMFFEASRNPSQSFIIDNNSIGYKIIFNRVVFLSVLLSLSDAEVEQYSNIDRIHKEFMGKNGGKSQKAYNAMYKYAASKLDNSIATEVDIQLLKFTLKYWEIKYIDESELGDTDYNEGGYEVDIEISFDKVKEALEFKDTDSSDENEDSIDDSNNSDSNEVYDEDEVYSDENDVYDENEVDSDENQVYDEDEVYNDENEVYDKNGISSDENEDSIDDSNSSDDNEVYDESNISSDESGISSDENEEISDDSDSIDETEVYDKNGINSDENEVIIDENDSIESDIDETEVYDEDEVYSDEKVWTDEERNRILSKIWRTGYLIEKRVPNDLLKDYLETRNIATRLKVNNFDYSNTEYANPKGLFMAVILLSNVHYASTRGINLQLDFLKKHYYGRIMANNDLDNKAKIALGILEDYDSAELSYDEMPEDVSIYIKRFVERLAKNELNFNKSTNDPSGIDESMLDDEDIWESILSSLKDREGSRDYWNVYTELPQLDTPSFKQLSDGSMVLEPRGTQSKNRLKLDTYVIPEATVDDKIKEKMFSSLNGVAYAFKLKWDTILNSINTLFKSNEIDRIGIVGNQLAINTKLVVLDNILGGEYLIKLEDICNLHDLLGRFHKVEQLTIDSNIVNCLIREYGLGSDGLKKLFSENPNLQVLGVLEIGGSKPTLYNRDMVESAPDAMAKQMKKHELRMGIEAFSAQNNPRLRKKTPGYIQNFVKTSAVQNGIMTGRARTSGLKDKDSRLLGLMSYSIGGSISILIDKIKRKLFKKK